MSALSEISSNTFNNRKVIRIPFPELSDFPAGLRNTAKIIESSVDKNIFKHILRDVAINHWGSMSATDLSFDYLNDSPIVKGRKSYYAGALNTSGTNYKLGVYNPDRITIDVYEKMRRHAQVALSLAVIKKPIEHVNFSIESDSEEIKALVLWNFKKIFTSLIHNLLTSIDFGASYNEKVWYKIPDLTIMTRNPEDKTDEILYNGEAWVVQVYPIHPSSIKIVLDKRGELTKIKQITSAFKEVPIKRSKLVYRVNNMEFGNWWGESRLKSAYTWWYWSEVALQFMLRYLERRAGPAIVVEAPEGYSINEDGERVDNQSRGLQLGMALNSNSVAVLPVKFDAKHGKNMWNVKYLTDDQRMFMFVEVLTFFNKMISRSLWVLDNVITQDSDGGFSAADARTDVHLVLEESIIKELEEIINTQVIPDIVKMNFPPERRRDCYITIEKLTITRKLMLKELLIKMLAVVNQMAGMGALFKYIPDLKAIIKTLELPGAPIEDVIDFSMYSPDGPKDDDITKDEKIKERNKNPDRPKRDRIVKRKKTVG